MSNPITPGVLTLVDTPDDELREILSGLNNQSLRKLTREAIGALVEHRNHIQYQREETDKLYKQLNDIAELAQRRD